MRKLILFFVLISISASAHALDVAIGIEELIPQAKYGGSTFNNTEEEFDNLRWEDVRPKPTWQQVVDAYNQWVIDTPDRESDEMRARVIDKITNDPMWRVYLELYAEREGLTKQQVINALTDKALELFP
jgi:hypothetical protein